MTTEKCIEILHDGVVNDRSDIELILEGRAVDSLSKRFPGKFRDLVENRRSKVYRYEGRFPFTLGSIDGSKLIAGAFDDKGVLHALIEIEDEEAVAWGKDKISSYREQSQKWSVEKVIG